MSKVKFFGIGVIAITMVFMVGCATVADSLVSGAASGLGRAVSERAEQAVYKKLAPTSQLPAPTAPGWGNFMALQAQVIFSYAFSVGGLWISENDYQPGQWTKFEMTEPDDDTKSTIERAFLVRTDDGKEWWRISLTEDEDSWVYEALLSPDSSKMVRLRGKDPKGNIGEIPLTTTTVYSEPTEMSEESIEGATIGKENISTPAGTFMTDKVEYLSTSGDGKIDWWITKDVPGGVVKYQYLDTDGNVMWTSTLMSTGDNATSVLNSY